jgi:hypothetical protein
MACSHYALSYTPPPYSPLARFGAGVLGYDCFVGADVPQLAVAGVDPAILSLLTVEPRRRGFHACLVPPFSLDAARETELVEIAVSLAKHFRPVPIGPLTLAYANPFIVLRAGSHPAQFEAFVGGCRRAADSLHDQGAGRRDDSSKLAFEMRLVGPVPAGSPDGLIEPFARAFEKFRRDEVEVGTISLMRREDPAERFRVLTCTRLTGRV